MKQKHSHHERRVLVAGAGGFIGGHLVKRLKAEGYWVRGVELKRHEFSPSPADDFIIGDLCNPHVAREAVEGLERSTSLPRIWVARDTSSPASTMRR